ncbi:MAG TPA: ATP-binding protein [Pyrinomonadaceae bacterium]|nr:ATP-binding protein [Pyrinomonadaceae bacterium]
MTRVPVLLLAAAAAALLLGAVVFALPLWTTVAGLTLVIAALIGLALQRDPQSNRLTGEASHGTEEFAPKLLDVALDEMREGLLVIDTDMRVVASNKAARDVLSETGPIEARRLTELTRNPAIYDAFLDALKGQQRDGVKVETYDSGRRVFDLRVVPFHANGRIAGAVGVLFDVTRLDRLEIVRQEFLTNVSHELRTPLTSILASAETLETGAVENAENSRRFLSIIQKNATRMERLIHDLLELGAIESGSVSVNPETVQLKSLVDDVMSSLAMAAAERTVGLRNLVPTNAQVTADPHRLVQMLTNLIDNAIKFNRAGGIVTLEYARNGNDRISVTDTGEGISTQHLDRLFERFYRVDRARSRELGGTGLGLAIVKHLAKAHGGEVSVTSRIGEGTQFTIELPRQTPSSRGVGTR